MKQYTPLSSFTIPHLLCFSLAPTKGWKGKAEEKKKKLMSREGIAT
jgi:hypothetical protein